MNVVGSGGAVARATRSLAPPVRIEEIMITTLTPVFNEERHVRATVAGLLAQDISGSAEFLFIDGMSTDHTRELLSELAASDRRIHILDNPWRHTAAALNIGLRASRGKYVARIDSHNRYPRGYLSRAVQRLERGDVDWVTGPQIPVGTNAWSRRVALALGSRLATGSSNRWQRDVARCGGEEVVLATGVFTGVWARRTLVSYRGWDEGWPVNQDSELASRMSRDGARIVSLPDLAAEYTPRATLRALARQYHRYGLYRAKTALRHPWTVRPPHVAMPALVSVAGVAVAGPRRARRRARAIVAAYCGVVVGESARVSRAAADRLTLPLVFFTMHGFWGAGFIAGVMRFARPSTRQPRLAGELGPATERM